MVIPTYTNLRNNCQLISVFLVFLSLSTFFCILKKINKIIRINFFLILANKSQHPSTPHHASKYYCSLKQIQVLYPMSNPTSSRKIFSSKIQTAMISLFTHSLVARVKAIPFEHIIILRWLHMCYLYLFH